MKKLFVLTGLILMSFLTSKAQAQGKVVFEKTEHDFGQIKEEDGPAQVSFEFTNTGNEAITLTNVKASCGCTTPTWTKEPVAPGKTGLVTAVYNPQNRPGAFNKTITINTDGEPKVVFLRIKGDVVPRPKGIADFYPTEMGNLRTNTRSVYFQKVYHDSEAQKQLVLYNQGETPITLDLEKSIAPLKHFLTVEASNTTIPAKDSVKLDFTYKAPARNDWGYVSDRMNLYTDDAQQPVKQFYVGANIEENFGDITADSKFPAIKFDKLNHDFGQINQGTRSTVAFEISNEGNAPLIIRKTKASCGCTASQPEKTELAPGESTKINVTYNSAGKSGQQRQSVTIIANDPANPTSRLNISANVIDSNPESGENERN